MLAPFWAEGQNHPIQRSSFCKCSCRKSRSHLGMGTGRYAGGCKQEARELKGKRSNPDGSLQLGWEKAKTRCMEMDTFGDGAKGGKMMGGDAPTHHDQGPWTWEGKLRQDLNRLPQGWLPGLPFPGGDTDPVSRYSSHGSGKLAGKDFTSCSWPLNNTGLNSVGPLICGFFSIDILEKIFEIYVNWKNSQGLPWWCSGWESACQCRGHEFEPWSGRIPHAAEQLGPWATIIEPARLEPVLRNKRGRDNERPAHRDEEWPPFAATRESPRTETKTQHNQKN